ncbi:MAG: phospholipase D-like domain-containing protein [Lachnospiraceae bacterium]
MDTLDGSKMKKTEYIKNKATKAKNTGLQAIFKLIFSRIMLTILMLSGQIYLLFILLERMNASNAKWWLYFFNICAALCIIVIINSDENPAFKLMWMIPMSITPVFGVLLYVFIVANPVRMGQSKGLKRRIDETKPYLQTSEKLKWKMKEEKSPISDLSYYIQNVNHFPTYTNTEVFYFANGQEKLTDLICEIEKAEKFIFLEYFIINKGYVWDTVLDALKKKATQGVEVRLMYDGFNSLMALPTKYARELTPYGIQVREFAPVRPFLSSHQNYRDHRKIVVIDGKVAFNGGINLADEYMNLKERFGYWKDTAVKIKGDAVQSFTAMFLQMWGMFDSSDEDYDKYLGTLPTGLDDKKNGNVSGGKKMMLAEFDATSENESLQRKINTNLGYVIPYNDDPCNRQDVAEEVYLDILNKARDYVWIMTPYLIPENEMITGLCFAAQRGVDVRIIMPHIPDKKIVFDIAHTYYTQLIDAGVKMYEFTPGFVHAKMFLCDDCKAVVGTINLDFRSLYEHFECATFIYDNPVIDTIKEDYLKTFDQCQEFLKEDYKKLPLLNRISGKVFRLFGPLL